MFCKYCGTKLVDNAGFCHECGKSTVEQPVCQIPVQPVPQPVAQPIPAPQPIPQPVYQQPVYQAPVPPVPPVQPAYQVPVYQQPAPAQYTYTVPPVQPVPAAPVNDPAVLEKLEKQILSCGIWGLCLSMLGVPGIVLSTIANKKANAYKRMTGTLSGKARAGYRMCKAGKAVGIIMTIIWFIVLSSLGDNVSFDFDNPFGYYDF